MKEKPIIVNMTPEMFLLSIWSLTKVPESVSPRDSVLRCIKTVVNDWYDNYRELPVTGDDNK